MAIIVAVAGAFPNSGNYGIPLVELAFGTDLVLPQAVITTLHLVLILITVPVLMAAERHGIASLVKELFKTPLVPAVLLAIALNVADVEIPGPIREPLAIMGAAYIPLALFVLGSQMRGVSFGGLKAAIGVATALRLLIAPALTFAALLVIGVKGVTLAFLTVGATAPVGVLLAVLSQEYGLRAELPAATVLITTILAPVAATVVLVLFQSV